MAYVFIFDCDGMLVESETLAMQAAADYIARIAVEQGKQLDPRDVLGHFGKSLPVILDTYKVSHGIVFDENAETAINDETVRVLGEKTEPTPGMIAFLAETDRQMQAGAVRAKGIATSSGLDRVIPALNKSGVGRFFRKQPIISAENAIFPHKSKPDPAVYNHAKQVLCVGEGDVTVAFEDSISGVKAAKAADMNIIFCVMHGGHMPKTAEARAAHAAKARDAGATYIVDALDDKIWALLKIAPAAPRPVAQGDAPKAG